MRNHFRLRLRRHLARQFPEAVHMIGVHALVKRCAKSICFRSDFRFGHVASLRNSPGLSRAICLQNTHEIQGSRASVPMSTREILAWQALNRSPAAAKLSSRTGFLVVKKSPMIPYRDENETQRPAIITA